MSSKLSLAKREPAAVVAAITGLVTAGLGLAVSFGLPVTAEQQTAILGLTAAILVVIFGGAAVTRKAATPNSRVVEKVDESTGRTSPGAGESLVREGPPEAA